MEKEIARIIVNSIPSKFYENLLKAIHQLSKFIDPNSGLPMDDLHHFEPIIKDWLVDFLHYFVKGKHD